jgi:hypothetical protein
MLAMAREHAVLIGASAGHVSTSRAVFSMSLEATATGNLQATPFGHLLVYLLDRGLTGSLVLEEPTGDKHAIWFETGAPAKVKTASPITYLGQVLIEQRAITREVYERTLQGALRERRLHGQVLLETGAIDVRVLRDALREQLARQVLWLFKLTPATAYGYYDQVNFLERWGAPEGLRTRPLALIWRGLRRHASAAEIEAVTGKLGQRSIELHVDAPIRRFRFEASEQALIDVLRAKPQSLSSLIASGLASPDDVKRLVYVLVILRQLELGVVAHSDRARGSRRCAGVRKAAPLGTGGPRFDSGRRERRTTARPIERADRGRAHDRAAAGHLVHPTCGVVRLAEGNVDSACRGVGCPRTATFLADSGHSAPVLHAGRHGCAAVLEQRQRRAAARARGPGGSARRHALRAVGGADRRGGVGDPKRLLRLGQEVAPRPTASRRVGSEGPGRPRLFADQ